MAATIRPGIQPIALKNLVFDPEIQVRCPMSKGQPVDKGWSATLADYWQGGSRFPPLGVIATPDETLLVWSGWHRADALRMLGIKEASCEVEFGSRADAIIKACGSNKSNGIKPMTNKDLKHACYKLFEFEDWLIRGYTDIASYVGCTPEQASRWKASFCNDRSIALPDEQTYAMHGGARRTVTRSKRRGCQSQSLQFKYPREDRTSEIGIPDIRKRLDGESLRDWLIERGIAAQLFSEKYGEAVCPGVILAGKAIVAACESDKASLLYEAIGKLMLARALLCRTDRSANDLELIVAIPAEWGMRLMIQAHAALGISFLGANQRLLHALVG